MKNLLSICMPLLSLNLRRTMLLIVLVTSFQGCKDPDITSEPAIAKLDEKNAHQALSSYLASITGAPVNKVKYVEEEQKFIIDGDMEMSKSSAEAYFNAEKTARVNQRRSVWLLNDNVAKDVKIFVNPGVTPEWREALRMAIFEWNFLPNMKVNFREVLVNFNADIVISTKFEAPNSSGVKPWVARQNMPDPDGTTGGGLTINTYYNPNLVLSSYEKQFVITHELGHAIGFGHTDKPTAGLIDFQVCSTPQWDDTSVMNDKIRSWGGFSYYDYIASTVLYPENNWTYFPGAATDVAAATGLNRALWSISKTPVNGGFTIQQFDYVSKTFKQVPGGAVRIAVGPDGIPWVVNNIGQIFKRVNGQWKLLPGNALDIAVSDNGNVFIISMTPASGGFAIKFLSNGQWKQMPGRGAMRISVSANGLPWAIDNLNKVLKWSAQGMVEAGYTGRDISVARDGSVFIIGTTPVPGGYSVKKIVDGCAVQLSGGGVAITVHGYAPHPVIINNLGMVLEN